MAIGPSSPIRRCLSAVEEIIRQTQIPKAGTAASRSAAAILATHALHCMRGAGMLNGAGHHSAAAALFRPIEDAIDCFAAVSLIEGAAERWQDGKLKASDAAKLWVATTSESFEHDVAHSLDDYRRRIRAQFNDYSHCHPRLAEWNLYLRPVAEPAGTTLELNFGSVIDTCAHRIDAHISASVWEFVDLLSAAFRSNETPQPGEHWAALDQLKPEFQAILDRHRSHGCFDVLISPEISQLSPQR